MRPPSAAPRPVAVNNKSALAIAALSPVRRAPLITLSAPNTVSQQPHSSGPRRVGASRATSKISALTSANASENAGRGVSTTCGATRAASATSAKQARPAASHSPGRSSAALLPRASMP